MIFPLWFVRVVALLDIVAFIYWAFDKQTGWAIYFLVCGILCLTPDIIDYFRRNK